MRKKEAREKFRSFIPEPSKCCPYKARVEMSASHLQATIGTKVSDGCNSRCKGDKVVK